MSSQDMSRSHRLMRLATYVAVATACLLMIVKGGAWVATGSLSLLASLVDSGLDTAASLVNLMAVRHALQPADRDHRFGHGKAESVAGLVQAAFIGGSALFLALESAQRMVSPVAVTREMVGIGVMLFAMAATALLVVFQRYVVRQTRSLAIGADSAHYTGDILVNASVIVAFLGNRFLGWLWIDAVFAFVISAYLARNAWRIGVVAFDQLMDKEMPEDERARIVAIALAESGVLALHDLRTRISGPNTFIQLHLEVEGDMPVVDAHDIAQRVEDALSAAFANAEVIVHIDPVGLVEPVANPAVLERVVAAAFSPSSTTEG
ncbi:MAG: cation diffusion facilitator family transporter [Rhodospirillaceae bacterium]|nr:cation diffusion facilitator family transporter [Rhodospirillaceae bacterium]